MSEEQPVGVFYQQDARTCFGGVDNPLKLPQNNWWRYDDDLSVAPARIRQGLFFIGTDVKFASSITTATPLNHRPKPFAYAAADDACFDGFLWNEAKAGLKTYS